MKKNVRLEKYFKGLKFDPLAHKYHYQGAQLPSVSSLISSFKPYFDTHEQAELTAYAQGITKEEVLAEWKLAADIACSRGDDIHNFGEFYVAQKWGLKTDAIPSDNYWPEYEAIKSFWDNLPDNIEPAALELRMFSATYGYAGTADIIVRNKESGAYIIMDYKTNKSLTKCMPGAVLLPPFEHLSDCALNHYSIQLGYYQMLLQEKVPVENRYIIHLIGEEYNLYEVQDLTHTLIEDYNQSMEDMFGGEEDDY